MAESKSWTKSLFKGLWTFLNFSRKLFFNIIFIVIIVGLFAALGSGEKAKVTVKPGSALVLDIYGDVVIEKRYQDPFDKFLQEAFEQNNERPEVLLKDVVSAIDNAKEDPRIDALVLKLGGMGNAGLDKLQQIAAAIERFKESEKPVYAIGDYYSQNQYFLASTADNIYMNPMGGMLLEGYGRYRSYLKEAMEKLKLTTHVFRVGTFKSAVEPFLRDDMSDAAKEANQAWLGALWEQYKQDVSKARDLPMDNFDEQIETLLEKLNSADGDIARYALDNGWVDALKTREEVRQDLAALVGEDKSKNGYKSISFYDYSKLVNSPFPTSKKNVDQVAVVVAKGTILNGTQKAGDIGGDSTAKLLRKARLNDDIKAVVLQVDSPGGSAFASEIIRQEIEQLKAAGKPVVASMSTYAASGGYWISASADEIWAAPSSITGSIGVFGMFMTYERTLDYLGVHADGVGTTDFAGISPSRALDPRIGQFIQRSIEHSYDQFITLVADERDMGKEAVDGIAQGRVWIGSKAKELGLVDGLGYLDDAVKSAAALAQLEKYDTTYVKPTLSPQEEFWNKIFAKGSVLMAKANIAQSDSHLMQLVNKLVSRFDSVAKLNDPKGVYVMCLECKI